MSENFERGILVRNAVVVLDVKRGKSLALRNAVISPTEYTNRLRAVVAAGVLAFGLVISGCSTGSPKETECPEGFDITNRPELNGLSLVEATQQVEINGGVIRVMFQNGKHLDGTADFLEERVNVALDHNIVICSNNG